MNKVPTNMIYNATKTYTYLYRPAMSVTYVTHVDIAAAAAAAAIVFKVSEKTLNFINCHHKTHLHFSVANEQMNIELVSEKMDTWLVANDWMKTGLATKIK